jgi:phosphoglycerate dehydrogenase-like enzyme
MNIIIPESIVAELEPRISAIAPEATVVRVTDNGDPLGDVSDAEVFIRWWTGLESFVRVLESAPRLRWVHSPSAGVDHLLIPRIMESEIILTNSAGAHAIPIAEFVLLYMLNHVKDVPGLKALPPEEWNRGDDVRCGELFDNTLLIVGLGAIGTEIARRARAFGMRVIGSRRHVRPTEFVNQVVGEHGWRALLPEADYVVLAAPLTEQTRGMFDADAFANMKPSAYLINIARGQIVDTDALLEALHTRRIAGCALDALPIEPLPPDHPLWRAPNTWVTPHISYSSPRTRGRMFEIFFDNLRRFQGGEPLVNVVDKKAGY